MLVGLGQPKSGCPQTWGIGEGLTTPHRKKWQLVTKCYKRLRAWTTLWNDL